MFSAPSGSGKTTLVRHLLKLKELNLEFSISATSREKRGDEIDGKDYYYLSLKEFKNNNFKILNINNISSDIKKLWVICYKPVMNFNCNISSDKQKSWILNETQKLHLLNAQLYEIKN